MGDEEETNQLIMHPRIKQLNGIIILTIVGVSMLTSFIRLNTKFVADYLDLSELYRTGIVTDTGIILDIDKRGANNNTYLLSRHSSWRRTKYAIVRYTVNNQPYTFESTFTNVPKFQEDRRVAVVYDATRTNHAEVYDKSVKRLWVIQIAGWLFVINGIVLFITVFLIVAYLKNRKTPLKKKK